MNIGMIILIIYLISVIGIAVYVSRKDEKNISTFATAGSSLGVFVLALTLSATYHSSYAFLGAPGFVYSNGVGWWANGIWTVFPGILFWYIGRRMWYLGKKRNYISMAQYVSDIYQNKKLGGIVTIITLIFSLPYVAMQAIGSGYIFETLSQGTLSYELGALIFLGVMVLIVFIGGMKGVAVTDAAQGVFMWIGLVAGSYWILRANFSSVGDAYASAYQQFPDLFTLPGPKGVVTAQDWISRWMVITIGMMMFPHITLRFFSGKSLRVLKWSSVFSSIYLTSIYFFTPAVGIVGNVLMPNLASPDTIFPELLLKYTPIVFAALMISGALAASMTTGDSQLHAVGTMISTDLYKVYIDENASEKNQYTVARIAILALGGVSIIIALMKPGLLGDLLALSNGGVAVLAPAVLGGIFWKKSNDKAAIASILVGELVLVITTFFIKSPLGFMPGFWALVTALIVFVGITLGKDDNPYIEPIISEMNEYFH